MPVKKKAKEAAETPGEITGASELETKRNALIDELRLRLLTKTQLKRGGGNVRAAHIAEQGYLAIIDEINELGKELGLASIGFGDIRKE